MDTCRLCLAKCKGNSLLDEDDVLEKIFECVSIKLSLEDCESSVVCESCLLKVEEFWEFKQMCKTSNLIHQGTKLNSKIVNIKKEDLVQDEVLENSQYDKIEIVNVSTNDYKSEIEDQTDENKNTAGTDSKLKCNTCNETFDTRELLVEHRKTAKMECALCGVVILEASMKVHLLKHSDQFKCTQCDYKCSGRSNLAQHVIIVHTDIRNYICVLCQKAFPSQSALNCHMKSHSDDRPYKCQTCDYAGRTAAALYSHNASHGNGIYICEICSHCFKSNRHLSVHKNRVHVPEKKHLCSYCGKAFPTKVKMTIHLRIHTGDRPYKCDLCQKSFSRSDALKDHSVVHGERATYECQECDKQFSTKRGAARHKCAKKGSE